MKNLQEQVDELILQSEVEEEKAHFAQDDLIQDELDQGLKAGSERLNADFIEQIETLEAQCKEAQDQAAHYLDLLQRSQAEAKNIRYRAELDIEKAHKFGLEKMMLDLLPIVDSLELGLEQMPEDLEHDLLGSLRKGTELTLSLLLKLLEKYQVSVVNPVDQGFNPELHQAMSIQAASGKESNRVLQVMQKGYTLNGRLLRPAMVIVAQ